MAKEEIIVINKQEAMSNFFLAYSGDVEGTLKTMSEDELLRYLDNDVFIGCASAATGIPEHEFVEFAIDYFKEQGND